MKKDIHPKYYLAKVVCACGNAFTIGSTHDQIRVEICANCHPFFTGEAKFVDTLGKVERFQKRQAQASSKQQARKKIEVRKETQERPANLYEMAKKIKQEFKNQES